MRIDLTKHVKKFIRRALKEEPLGSDWLRSRYLEQTHWVGHTQPYYNLFYILAKELKPQAVVELGSWQATGAAHFAEGNPEAKVITIDIHKDDKIAQERAIEAANFLDNLYYINKWTWDAIEDVKKILGNLTIDILFIDAWHNKEMATKEWKLYQPLLSEPALVICDDITDAHNFEGMYEFWDQFKYLKFLNEKVHPGIPMGFIKYDPSRKTPTLNTQIESTHKRGTGRSPSKISGKS